MGKQHMNSLQTNRSALFQISQPLYAYTENNRVCLGHALAGDALTAFTRSPEPGQVPFTAFAPAIPMSALGDRAFTARHRLTYPYIAGAMANGISSVPMVQAMAENGMMGFFGAGGLTVEKIRDAAITLNRRIPEKPFGFNLIHSLGDPELEMATVQVYLDHGIRLISAAAFMRMTPALVYYRIKGIHQTQDGRIIAPNQIIAKVSRIEVARHFFSPPPEKLVQALVADNRITPREARLSQYIPMAQDLTAEADSGGHTDNRPAPGTAAHNDGTQTPVHGPIQVCISFMCGPGRRDRHT
jgi:trans-AT polyketide synthase, acyltransferase and oxidoreductase domains